MSCCYTVVRPVTPCTVRLCSTWKPNLSARIMTSWHIIITISLYWNIACTIATNCWRVTEQNSQRHRNRVIVVCWCVGSIGCCTQLNRRQQTTHDAEYEQKHKNSPWYCIVVATNPSVSQKLFQNQTKSPTKKREMVARSYRARACWRVLPTKYRYNCTVL